MFWYYVMEIFKAVSPILYLFPYDSLFYFTFLISLPLLSCLISVSFVSLQHSWENYHLGLISKSIRLDKCHGSPNLWPQLMNSVNMWVRDSYEPTTSELFDLKINLIKTVNTSAILSIAGCWNKDFFFFLFWFSIDRLVFY